MIDKFTIFLPHLLMALVIWRVLRRADLDDDPSLPNRRTPFREPRGGTRSEAPGQPDA